MTPPLTDDLSIQDHDEIMEVLEGRMIFYLDGRELVTSAGDAPIIIPRGHIHGFTAST
jgi:quercetin dioxygenase-like cupin family protein